MRGSRQPGGRITVVGEREGSEAVLHVRDTGMGIAPELLPRIFDLFTQGERAVDRPEGGLGLTLVKRLGEAHGGRIEAHSAGKGHGSEFVVRLPALPAVREPRPAAPTAAVAVRPRRILVVDDNIDSAEKLTDLLGLGGHAVRTVHDGLAAVDEVLADPPEVILLDIGLPGMNGFDVARKLREWEAEEQRATRMLIIALTGYGQAQDQQRSKEVGFDHHPVKPVDAKQLLGLLAAAPAAARTRE